MAGLPVTIRLLDPPLHEFLPHDRGRHGGGRQGRRRRRAEIVRRAPPSCTSPTRCSAIRGCRLGITYPEIYEMQARAIFEAAVEVAEEGRQDGDPRDHDPAGRDRDASST